MRIQFVQDFIDAIRRKNACTLSVLSKPHRPPAETYKHLVCITGFGHSGSGAVADFLGEFDNATIYAHHDPDGGSPLSKGASFGEITFMRDYGGVFDLERAFAHRSLSSFVYLLNFINVAEYCYKSNCPIYDDKFMEITRKFVDKLICGKYKMQNICTQYPAFAFKESCSGDYRNIMSPFLDANFRTRERYILKNLSVKEYRQLAKEYILEFLSQIESKEFCVLDQALSDATAEFDRYADFLGGYKVVAVYRDPRDVFVTGVRLNESWIPHDKEGFVAWFNDHGLDRYLASDSPHLLLLRFEDLVLNYDISTAKLMDFLGLKRENHCAPKSQFRPEYSVRNIGLHQNFEDQEAMRYIESRLSKYCWRPEP